MNETRLRFVIGLLAATAWLDIVAVSAATAEPAYALQTTETKTIRGIYSFEIVAPKMAVKEWILFAAQAPELPGQRDTHTTLTPLGRPYEESSPRHRALLRARIGVADKTHEHKVAARIEWQATLYSRRLVSRSPGEKHAAPQPPSTAERTASLAETKTLDFSAADFQDWLNEHHLRRRRGESDVDFGRRAFLAVTRSLKYQYSENMDRRASHLCSDDAADCGGMSVLFVAALRANQIPARVLLGRWAKSSKPDEKLDGFAYYQQHIKAEFYADGIGWIPVDCSSAVVHDKTPEGLQYFGNDRGDFLVVHVDPDLRVDSVHWGVKDIVMLQSFYYFASGSGKLDSVTFNRTWTVETVE
jgi:transglutaminase-like putative cysteine protease